MGKTIAGGLFYVGGVAVDANGKHLPDAPEQGPDTVPTPATVAAPGAAMTAEQIDKLVSEKVAATVAAMSAATAHKHK